VPDRPHSPAPGVESVRPRTASFDPVIARTAAVNIGILNLVLRPVGPMRVREFDLAVLVLVVALARAEHRRAGGRR
jgi:hypothetical protein